MYVSQTSPLTALPEEVLELLFQQLDSKNIGQLRLTCKELLDLVSEQTLHIHTKRNITRKRAADLLTSFSNVVSLSYHKPDETTYHLASLRQLTSLTLSVAIPCSYLSEEHFQSVDLGPLEDLPHLRHLCLEAVMLPRLVKSQDCALATLTQLSSLHLAACCTRTAEGRTPDIWMDVGSVQPHSFRSLPQLTKLQVVDSILWLQPGIVNLHMLEILELHIPPDHDCGDIIDTALPTCTRLHTLVLVGANPLDLAQLFQAPQLASLALNFCAGLDAEKLTTLTSLRHLDLSNSCLGHTLSAGKLMGALEALQLHLCILTVPTAPLPDFAAHWQPGRLSKVLRRSLSTHERLRGERHPEEWWLASPNTGKYLESMGLLNEGIWDGIRAAKPPFVDHGLLAFMQLVAEGLSYQAMPSSQAPEEFWVDCAPGTTLLCAPTLTLGRYQLLLMEEERAACASDMDETQSEHEEIVVDDVEAAALAEALAAAASAAEA